MIPIKIAVFLASFILFLFEQSKEDGGDLGTALVNAFLGVSFISSFFALFFTYALLVLQIFPEREDLPSPQPHNDDDNHPRGKLLIWLAIWLPYLSFSSLLAAIVVLFLIR